MIGELLLDEAILDRTLYALNAAIYERVQNIIKEHITDVRISDMALYHIDLLNIRDLTISVEQDSSSVYTVYINGESAYTEYGDPKKLLEYVKEQVDTYIEQCKKDKKLMKYLKLNRKYRKDLDKLKKRIDEAILTDLDKTE